MTKKRFSILWLVVLPLASACGSNDGGASTATAAVASASQTAVRSSEPKRVAPVATSGKGAHAELSIHKVTTPSSVSDEFAGVRKGTTTPPGGSKFVLVEAAVRVLDCVVDTGGPPPSTREAASAAAAAPKIAPVASEAAALVGGDGTRVRSNGGGETADSVCTGCDASYNPPCTGDKPPDAQVTMFFLFAVPSAFDLSSASFEYADARAKLPPVAQ